MTPRTGRIRFEEAAEDILNDYRTNGKRSLKVVERRITKYLSPFFGGRRMVAITTSDVRQFIVKRQAETVLVRKARLVKRGDACVQEPEVRRQCRTARSIASSQF